MLQEDDRGQMSCDCDKKMEPDHRQQGFCHLLSLLLDNAFILSEIFSFSAYKRVLNNNTYFSWVTMRKKCSNVYERSS